MSGRGNAAAVKDSATGSTSLGMSTTVKALKETKRSGLRCPHVGGFGILFGGRLSSRRNNTFQGSIVIVSGKHTNHGVAREGGGSNVVRSVCVRANTAYEARSSKSK